MKIKKIKKVKKTKKIEKKKPKRKPGRPPGPGKRGHRTKITINFSILQKLCKLQATAEEIAGVLECSVDTLERRIDEEYKITFAEYYNRYSSSGKVSLRRTQIKLSKKDSRMAIHLGKQMLGQSEVTKNENNNTNKNFIIIEQEIIGKESESKKDNHEDT